MILIFRRDATAFLFVAVLREFPQCEECRFCGQRPPWGGRDSWRRRLWVRRKIRLMTRKLCTLFSSFAPLLCFPKYLPINFTARTRPINYYILSGHPL